MGTVLKVVMYSEKYCGMCGAETKKPEGPYEIVFCERCGAEGQKHPGMVWRYVATGSLLNVEEV